jgi:hypothetical protein
LPAQSAGDSIQVHDAPPIRSTTQEQVLRRLAQGRGSGLVTSRSGQPCLGPTAASVPAGNVEREPQRSLRSGSALRGERLVWQDIHREAMRLSERFAAFGALGMIGATREWARKIFGCVSIVFIVCKPAPYLAV